MRQLGRPGGQAPSQQWKFSAPAACRGTLQPRTRREKRSGQDAHRRPESSRRRQRRRRAQLFDVLGAAAPRKAARLRNAVAPAVGLRLAAANSSELRRFYPLPRPVPTAVPRDEDALQQLGHKREKFHRAWIDHRRVLVCHAINDGVSTPVLHKASERAALLDAKTSATLNVPRRKTAQRTLWKRSRPRRSGEGAERRCSRLVAP